MKWLSTKNAAIAQNSAVPATQLAAEFQPLDLSEEEISDLTTFIETGLYDGNLQRLRTSFSSNRQLPGCS